MWTHWGGACGRRRRRWSFMSRTAPRCCPSARSCRPTARWARSSWPLASSQQRSCRRASATAPRVRSRDFGGGAVLGQGGTAGGLAGAGGASWHQHGALLLASITPAPAPAPAATRQRAGLSQRWASQEHHKHPQSPTLPSCWKLNTVCLNPSRHGRPGFCGLAARDGGRGGARGGAAREHEKGAARGAGRRGVAVPAGLSAGEGAFGVPGRQVKMEGRGFVRQVREVWAFAGGRLWLAQHR